MKKTKVLFIWHAAVVETYQKYIAELAEHDDLDITLLIPQRSFEGSKSIQAYVPKNAKYNIIVGYALSPEEPLISIYPALPFHLIKTKPDIIHLFEEPWHNIASYLNFWTNIICPKAKLIFQTFQNQIENYPKNWQKTQNWTFKRSSAAIACSEEIKDVLEHWGYNKPIHVIYPGVETKLFNPEDATQIRHNLGLKEFTIGYFGRMVKDKGVEDLITASKLLDFPHQLFLLGNGKDKDYFKTLTDKAIWVDAVDPNEMNKYYSALDVLVLPSRTTPKWKEQFGRVLVEAMLCGTPVIGSSSGEIPKVMGEAGLVFKEQDPKDLAEKIKLMHIDSNLRNKLIENGLSRARTFDWKYTADKVYLIYSNMV